MSKPSHKLHGSVAVFGLFAKPDQSPLAPLKDVSYQPDLSVTLLDVGLIDADGIGPKRYGGPLPPQLP
jgi:hypothetical protein